MVGGCPSLLPLALPTSSPHRLPDRRLLAHLRAWKRGPEEAWAPDAEQKISCGKPRFQDRELRLPLALQAVEWWASPCDCSLGACLSFWPRRGLPWKNWPLLAFVCPWAHFPLPLLAGPEGAVRKPLWAPVGGRPPCRALLDSGLPWSLPHAVSHCFQAQPSPLHSYFTLLLACKIRSDSQMGRGANHDPVAFQVPWPLPSGWLSNVRGFEGLQHSSTETPRCSQEGPDLLVCAPTCPAQVSEGACTLSLSEPLPSPTGSPLMPSFIPTFHLQISTPSSRPLSGLMMSGQRGAAMWSSCWWATRQTWPTRGRCRGLWATHRPPLQLLLDGVFWDL